MDPRSLRCSLRAGLAILWLALSVIPLSASAHKSPGGARYGSGSEIILQGFHWNSSRMPTAWYVTLKQKAPTIAEDGFTGIWMPPSWRDDSSWKGSIALAALQGVEWKYIVRTEGNPADVKP